MTGGDYHLSGPQPETPKPEGELEQWTETTVVGKPLRRVDAYLRVSGTAVFPSDVTLPDMLYGAILRCPHAHARVVSVDTSAAEAMPGVRAVLSNADPEAAVPWPPGADNPASVLFDEHCLYDGEEVAAVAAETPQEAWEAARAIEVEYEVLPSVVDAEDALEEGAPLVKGGKNSAGTGRPYKRGDLAQGFAAADVVLEHTYRTPCELHTPLEPHGCVARWDGNRLAVWESTQGVFAVQRDLALALGLRLAAVRVIGHYMGGGFGSKLKAGKYTVIAALLAKKTARPVKLFLTREETMVAVGNRPAARMRLKAGVKRDGTLTALAMDTLGSGGARSRNGIGLVDWQVRDLYRCPNVRTGGQNVYINAGEQRPMRGPGHPQGSWALEQMMDALAAELDMDPVELRLRNLTDVSQARDNQPYASTGFKECLEQGAQAFGWADARGRQSDGPIRRGVGMAGCLWVAGGGGPPSTVIVKFFADGSVNLNMGAADLGTGAKTVMAMVVAEELGVPLEAIQIEHADTGTTEYASPSGGSKTVPSDGPAVRAAAIACKEQILQMAARQLEVEPEALALEAGAVIRKANPKNRTPFRKVRGLQRAQVVIGIGYRGPNPDDKATCPFAAQFCEVEVDTRTGEVKVLRFLAAQDSGRVMNRRTFDNQVYGGITMGIGLGMTERRVLDRGQTGKLVSESWHDYKIPTALDVPADITSLPIETDSSAANTIGAKGLGEPVTIPTAAAIANAVYDAVGVRVTDAPINPTRLLEMLQAGRQEVAS